MNLKYYDVTAQLLRSINHSLLLHTYLAVKISYLILFKITNYY